MIVYIVSGLSGSGKSVALQVMEDMGFYCIDNLPAALLPSFAKQTADADSAGLRNTAVGIDARNRRFLDALPQSLEALMSQGRQYRIIFLEADDAVLIKRFNETRRRHPLTDEKTSLLEGIRQERMLLEPLSFNADMRIDTTHTRPQELRQLVRAFAATGGEKTITLLFKSFGFKHGTPMDADYVFDVRCLPNPYWQTELRGHSGLDEPVIKFLERQEQVGIMFEQLCTFLERWLPDFEQEQRSYMTIAIGCTGGQHRSVYLAKRLAEHFAAQGINSQAQHRELA